MYLKQLPQEGLIPGGLMNVIVYIHGGAFQFGAGIGYGLHYLLDSEDFVYVSINYRLGPLGFASTGDDVLPGNNGLKDQVAALKWIQRNIAAFGGNPGSVTIAGMSAGGASVHYHVLSPMSQGKSSEIYCIKLHSFSVNKLLWFIREKKFSLSFEGLTTISSKYTRVQRDTIGP